MKTFKIFLASSAELKEDRDQLRLYVSTLNDLWHDKGLYLKLVQWEHFLDALSGTRLQDEYNKVLKECDMVWSMFYTKVGKYTKEEFKAGYDHFKQAGKPLMYTYFKSANVNISNLSDEFLSLLAFRKELNDLGHFPSYYSGIDDLKNKFRGQLDELMNTGKIVLGHQTNHPAPPPPNPTPTGPYATVLVEADMDCTVTVNGEEMGQVRAGQPKKVAAEKGDNLLIANSLGTPVFAERGELHFGASEQGMNKRWKVGLLAKKKEWGDALGLPEMVWVEGGSFEMGYKPGRDGEDDEWMQDAKPLHNVALDGFYLAKYPVTVGQFRKFVETTRFVTEAEKDGGSYFWNGEEWVKKKKCNWRCDVDGYIRDESEDKHPVIHVSWNDAQAYCDWVSYETGETYRLPTEAEWEYAARAGNRSNRYAGANNVNQVGWNASNSNDKTHPVGQKSPNELGLYDMTGNVWEWCEDWYGNYPSSPRSNPRSPESHLHYVYRGGSWFYTADLCRVAVRGFEAPEYRSYDLGFRLARNK